jgi:hypothetical protein
MHGRNARTRGQNQRGLPGPQNQKNPATIAEANQTEQKDKNGRNNAENRAVMARLESVVEDHQMFINTSPI